MRPQAVEQTTGTLLASTVAAPRTVAGLLLIIDLVGSAPLAPNAWRQADRKAVSFMALGALITVPIGLMIAGPIAEATNITTVLLYGAVVAAALLILVRPQESASASASAVEQR